MDTNADTQTYFGGGSDGLVNILTEIESSWFYTGLRMGDYTRETIMTIQSQKRCI